MTTPPTNQPNPAPISPNSYPTVTPSTRPTQAPCQPVHLRPPTLPEKSSLTVDKLAVEREPLAETAATPAPCPLPSPACDDVRVRRCAAVAKSGERCRREGRGPSGWLCKHHHPDRRAEVLAEQRKGFQAATRNRIQRAQPMPESEVQAALAKVKEVNGRPQSLAAFFDWLAEGILRGTILPPVARQLRILAGRRQRILASYARPKQRWQRIPATVPPDTPEPTLPPLGPSASPDAPTGILGANTGTPVHGDETPTFALPDAPPFDIPAPQA